MKESPTIVAQSTPQGTGALAIIRISGPKAIEICSKTIVQREKFNNAATRKVLLYTIHHPIKKQEIDEISAIKYKAPRSFTGENMVEIICHGGSAIVMGIIDALLASGASMAGRGDFTRQALENGKIDLLKAEAIKGMIESTCEPDLKCAHKLYHGDIKDLSNLKERINSLQSDLEAEIEFGEEEQIIENRVGAREKLKEIIHKIGMELERRKSITNIENGIKLVIAGPVNAGKSTLFNRILGYERALTHHEPGTTRDTVSERILIIGHEVKIIDCAGIRDTSHEVEKKGIQKTLKAIQDAHIVLWVTAANESIEENEKELIINIKGKKVIGVINKCDINDGVQKETFFRLKKLKWFKTSLKNGEKIEILLSWIKKVIKDIYSSLEIPGILFNKRHEDIGKTIFEELIKTEKEWNRKEIAAYHLRNARQALEEIFGAQDNEQILNSIFDSFCIGK
jgi:tRNA modification GTPase